MMLKSYFIKEMFSDVRQKIFGGIFTMIPKPKIQKSEDFLDAIASIDGGMRVSESEVN